MAPAFVVARRWIVGCAAGASSKRRRRQLGQGARHARQRLQVAQLGQQRPAALLDMCMDVLGRPHDAHRGQRLQAVVVVVVVLAGVVAVVGLGPLLIVSLRAGRRRRRRRRAGCATLL